MELIMDTLTIHDIYKLNNSGESAMNKLPSVLGLALFIGLSGCANGPTISQTSSDQSALKAGLSRIVIYRPKISVGSGIQPMIKVNEKKTAQCKPNGVFFVDVPEGEHQISGSTEVRSKITVDTKKSDLIYVRCGISLGLFVGHPTFKLVPNSEGILQTNDLSFTGQF
jgi:hypothetical protein